MLLSPHFSLEEAFESDEAREHLIDNTPSTETINTMAETAQQMEDVRQLLRSPIHVNSWYRCLSLNRLLGSEDTSDHLKGLAVDFTCPRFGDPISICKEIADSDIEFDQLILERTWVHISFAPEMRGETLTAHFQAGQKTTYTEGFDS